jgi:hypothetical protein
MQAVRHVSDESCFFGSSFTHCTNCGGLPLQSSAP